MLSFWIFSLHLIVFQSIIKDVRTGWPLFNSSNMKILGIFSDEPNSSKTDLWSIQSRAMFKSAIILSHEYNIKIQDEYLNYEIIQTGGDVMNALGETCRLITNSTITGIIGPGLSRESEFIGPFAGQLGLPVLSYASTNPNLSNRNLYSTFYRTVPSDEIAARAIADLFLHFNWTSCIIIYQNDVFGSNGAKSIQEEFLNKNLLVTTTIEFDIITQNFKGNFPYILRKSSTRIIILWTEIIHGNAILENALENDLVGPHYTWILSSSIPLNNFNKTSYEKLNGLFVIEPVVGNVVNAPINGTLLNSAYQIWQKYEPESFPGLNFVDYYALFAFDATWILIDSLQKFASLINTNLSSIEYQNHSFCFDQRFFKSNLLFNIINNISYLGVSGLVQFNNKTSDRITGIYYVMKNLQLSLNNLNYVPVLLWSSENTWRLYSSTSVILWPGNSLVIPTGYGSLSGVHLRIAVTETAPFTMITEGTDETGTKLIGYVPDLIDLLADQIGFIPNISLVINKTFNEIVNLVANDVYDMFVAQTTITAARREIVDFTDSIYDNSLRIIMRKDSNNEIDIFSYLKPFSTELWLTLLCACLFASFLICFLERHENDALQNRSIISLISMSIWYSIGTLFGYGVDFHLTTAAGRLLTIGLYILSIVFVAAYTANLASELTLSKSQNIIDGIDDIKSGKIPFSRIGIVVGTSFEYYYLREISGGIRNFYPLKTKSDVYDALLNNIIDASIMDASVSEYITSNVYCNLTLIGKDFNSNSFGIVIQKSWQYEQILNINLLSLREAGQLDTLKRKWFTATFCSDSSDTSDSSQAMTIQSMVGLFLTFAVISIFAVLLFLWKKRFIITNKIIYLIRKKKLLHRQHNIIVINHSMKDSHEKKTISTSPTFTKSAF